LLLSILNSRFTRFAITHFHLDDFCDSTVKHESQSQCDFVLFFSIAECEACHPSGDISSWQWNNGVIDEWAINGSNAHWHQVAVSQGHRWTRSRLIVNLSYNVLILARDLNFCRIFKSWLLGEEIMQLIICLCLVPELSERRHKGFNASLSLFCTRNLFVKHSIITQWTFTNADSKFPSFQV
jgi:hypothetical protein